MVYGWMKKDLKRHVYGEGDKRKHPSTSLRHMGTGLHTEIGCRKVHSGKIFAWQNNSMKAKETFGMAVAEIMQIASQLIKIIKMQQAGCQLCKKVRCARVESTDNLTVETDGHISSSGCKGRDRMFIIWQPPKGENDDYDNENFWI